jgi:hypothetical protein
LYGFAASGFARPAFGLSALCRFNLPFCILDESGKGRRSNNLAQALAIGAPIKKRLLWKEKALL